MNFFVTWAGSFIVLLSAPRLSSRAKYQNFFVTILAFRSFAVRNETKVIVLKTSHGHRSCCRLVARSIVDVVAGNLCINLFRLLKSSIIAINSSAESWSLLKCSKVESTSMVPQSHCYFQVVDLCLQSRASMF